MTKSSEDRTLSSSETEFVQSCRNYLAFPGNLVNSRHGASVRNGIAETLKTEAERVFDDGEEEYAVNFIDIFSENEVLGVASTPGIESAEQKKKTKRGLQFEDVSTHEGLVEHLHKYEEDPRWRHISIQSGSSKDPLKISPDMFKYLCSYHQIPPMFLDSVFSFGSTLSHFDCSLAMFSEENTLFARKQDSFALPKLGRSGREIRQSFLLRSVESSGSLPNWKWGVRQLAVYHSFDVVTGRTTWITLKGNELIEDRMYEAVSENPAFSPLALNDVNESFSATLEVHSMLLDWIDENWRWYINAFEAVIRPITKKARLVVVDDHPHLKAVKKNLSQMNMDEPVRNLSLAATFASARHQFQDLRRRITFPKNDATSPPKSPDEIVGKGIKTSESEVDKIMNLERFSIRELQKLQEVTERVQDARLVLDLNLKVVRQIREHYQTLVNEYQVPEMKEIKKHCHNDFLRFVCRSKAVESNIETRASQLNSLLAIINEGKILYDGILQFRNLQINKMYAKSAHESSKRMQTIAYQTKEETSSMHIVTIVTLIFLPWTFIASFFQSGILQWTNPDLQGKTWLLNRKVFSLFAGISVAMMVLMLSLWFTVLHFLRKKSNAREKAPQKATSVGSDAA